MQNSLTIPTQPGAMVETTTTHAMVEGWTRALQLRVMAMQITHATAITYQTGLRKFLTWCGPIPLDELTADSIVMWQAAQMETGNKPKTANTWLAGIKSFFKWAAAHGLETDPAAEIEPIGKGRQSGGHLRDILTDEEMRRVELCAQADQSPAGRRNYALFMLMAYTAIRSVEIHRADLEDLQPKGGRLVLMVLGKGRIEKNEFIVIPAKVEGALHAWLEMRGNESGPLFLSFCHAVKGERRLSLRSIREIVKEFYRAAGVVGIHKTTHSLRHTAITNAIRRGVPLHQVMQMSRHAKSETLLIYYHDLDRLTSPAEDAISYD